MILQILTGLMAGTAMVMITKTLVIMALNWANGADKWEPKMRNPPKQPTFERCMELYKEAEYNNSLNDN